MVYEKRYNDIIDRMIAEERQEAMAFQKVVYPVVGLFVSTIIAAASRPKLFAESTVIGRIIIVSLFIVGVIQLAGRLRDGFERYTQEDDNIHESILDEAERKTKPYSRLTASAALFGGVLLCLAVGLLIGNFANLGAILKPDMFFPNLQLPESLEMIFYPPIITMFVDLIHTIAVKFER